MTKEEKAVVKAMEVYNEALTAWAYAYYVLDAPEVSDDVYNETYELLRKLEQQYPHLIRKDSVVQIITSKPLDVFKKVPHTFPMNSIRTITHDSPNALKDFIAKVIEATDIKSDNVDTVIGEHKYDGLAVSLIYRKGELKRAVTRGDFETGEDVTHNALAIADIPKYLPEDLLDDGLDVNIEVRGEILMPRHSFKAINKKLIAQGKEPLSNTRNAAAGAVRQLSSVECLKRGLTFMAYAGYDVDGNPLTVSHGATLQMLKQAGFKIGEYKNLNTFEQALAFYEDVKKKRTTLDYEIDGVIFKARYQNAREKLGSSLKEPNWAVAFKFPPEEASSVIKNIRVQVGRTGKITPVADIEEVFVGGVNITNVTLHNLFDLRKRGVRAGDKIIVRRAGDVIPEIVGVHPLNTRSHYLPNFKMPKQCPSCGSKLVRPKGKSNYFCTGGFNCPDQRVAALIHFTSRETLNIVNFGDVLCEKIIEKNLIEKLSDVFTLDEEKFLAIEGLGFKSILKLSEAIAKAQHQPLYRIIYALGIVGVGEGTSRALAKHLQDNLGKLLQLTYDELIGIPDIGPITAKSIIDYISDPRNQVVVNDLVELPMVIIKSTNKSFPLEGVNIVVTGSFKGPMTRSEITDRLKSEGATVSSSVGRKTNYVVAGINSTVDKLNKANALGVRILNEAQLFALAGW